MFKIEITSIQDFLVFVNVIRNKDLNVTELSELVKTLNESSTEVQEAVNAYKP